TVGYTLKDPDLRLLDSAGNELASSDDISPSNWGSQINYTPTTESTYYLEASSSPGDHSYTTGSYRLYTSASTSSGATVGSFAATSNSSESTLIPVSAGEEEASR